MYTVYLYDFDLYYFISNYILPTQTELAGSQFIANIFSHLIKSV